MAENRELALVLKLVADQFQSELRNSQGALASFNNFIKDWRTQVTAAGTALFAIAKSTANYGDELFKTSQKVGIQVEALAGLQHAAKLADVDNRQLQIGLQALSRAMVDSAQGAGEGFEAFKRVGVSATDANGKLKPMQDVLLELADVFSKTQDGAGKTEVAMKLLGKSGVDLIPLLNSGKAGIQELMAEAEKLGLVMSEQNAVAAEQFNDAITRLEAQARGFSVTIGTHMLGPLTELLSLMNDLGGGPIADAAKFFFKGLNEQLVLFGTLLKEVGAGVDFVLGKWDFDQLQTKIKQLEAEAGAKLLLLENPEAAKYLDGPVKDGRSVEMGVSKPGIASALGKADTDVGKEQERLGKALLEIYLAQNRALEIRWKLQQGPMQDEQVLERARAEEAEIEAAKGRRIIFDTQQMLAQQEQERLGRQIIQQTQAQLAIDEQRRQAGMTFFDHWRDGLQRYYNDSQSAFGFAADLARRTAQQMEGAFRTLFFDLMDNKITSLKDLFASFANFAKQMIAQVLAQLATMALLKGVTGGFGGFGGFGSGLSDLFGGGGFGAAQTPLFGFARGGPVLGAGNSDTVRAMLTPGEGVLSRKGMQNLARLNEGMLGGSATSAPNITVNIQNSGWTTPPTINYRRHMRGMIIDVINHDPDLRQMLGGYRY
ncbi:MAG: phage tail tape measure protein [Nitrospira sp.]|nr:phage tail tape measure protein [Nitrospira sp.]